MTNQRATFIPHKGKQSGAFKGWLLVCEHYFHPPTTPLQVSPESEHDKFDRLRAALLKVGQCACLLFVTGKGGHGFVLRLFLVNVASISGHPHAIRVHCEPSLELVLQQTQTCSV